MTDHILCAVDLTHVSDAKAIILEANRLSELYGAALSVVTVLPDYHNSWVGSFFKEGTLDTAAHAAMETLRGLVDETLGADHKVQKIVEIGSVYEKVLETQESTKSDMIVIGAHRPDIADRILGPNASHVVRHAGVSVVILRL